MELNSNLPMCAKAYKCITLSLALSAIMSFPQLLRCKTDMIVSYHILSTLLAMLLCLCIQTSKECGDFTIEGLLMKGLSPDSPHYIIHTVCS